MSTAPRIDPDELYRQLLALPDGHKGEIIGGELVVSPRPSVRHQRGAGRIVHRLVGAFDEEDGEGPRGWWFLAEPELHLGAEVLSPDIAGWKRETLPELPDSAFIDVAPDWVCEVLSPSTARRDRGAKAQSHHRVGVTWRWLVDPEAHTVEAYRREGAFWVLLGTWEEADMARIEPFDAVELDLARWWLRTRP